MGNIWIKNQYWNESKMWTWHQNQHWNIGANEIHKSTPTSPTKDKAPTNLIKSFKSEPSFSLKPELSASNRRGKNNSDHTNHHSGSLSHKTSYIFTILNKWLSSWNDQKKHSAKQFSLNTQGRHTIMAPKSFVLDLILTPFDQYPVLGGVRHVTSSRISREQTQLNRVCCFPTLAHRGSTVGFLLLHCSSSVVRHPRDLQVSVATRFCRVLIFASS